MRPWYHPGSPPSRDGGLASRGRSVAHRRDVGRGNGGQTGDAYWAVSVGDARDRPRWRTRLLRRTLARLGSRLGGHVRTVCRRRHHTSRGSLSRQEAVYSSSSSPWVPAPERRNKKPPRNVVVDVHIAHLAGCSPAGIGTRRINAGCRASKGRFPPPLWMSAGLHSLVEGDDSRRLRRMSRGKIGNTYGFGRGIQHGDGSECLQHST